MLLDEMCPFDNDDQMYKFNTNETSTDNVARCDRIFQDHDQ